MPGRKFVLVHADFVELWGTVAATFQLTLQPSFSSGVVSHSGKHVLPTPFPAAKTVIAPDFRAQTIITPDQHQLRAGIWSMPARATSRAICVLLNGHTEFLEKYAEVARELCARGFEVVSLDWRGQGASERRVYGNRAGHIGSFEEYDIDLAALILQVVEPMQRSLPAPLPLVAVAHSMGGHILLRYLHDHPRRFLCAVLCAPMVDIETGKFSPTVAQLVAWLLNLRRPSKRAIFGIERHDPLELRFEDNVVTSDLGRFERNQDLLRQQPFLRISGPTFGWLGAAFQSIRRMRRRRFAADIVTPLLVFGAGEDKVVHSEAIRALCQRLPNARYVEIKDARHEILMETDAIRAEFWRDFDAFMDVHVPRRDGA